MHDYSHQNLKGRSFRGLKLAYANFSGADLRGVGFRGADLSGAQFCGAHMGKTWQRSSLMFLLSMALGGCSGILMLVSSALIDWVVDGLSECCPLTQSTLLRVNAIVGYSLVNLVGVLLALKRQNWSLLWLWQLGIIAVAGTGAITASVAGFKAVGPVVAAEISIAVAAGVALAVVGAVAAAAVGTVATVGAATIAIAIAGAGPEAASVEGAVTGARATIVLWFTFGYYLNWRGLNYEEPLLQALRHWILAWSSWHGTDFRNANLQSADFNQTDLRDAQFCGTQLIGCRWQNAQNLHLADTRRSLLEPRPVRALLSTGEITTRDFSHFNLRGAVLAGLGLQGINFYHADLSLADFRGCNLSDCDLSEAMALGTNFGEANFTGAIIDSWNIDKTTQFEGAQCRFVYLKHDKNERNPPQGEFGDGDFAKLYQEIANTVDFIAHTPAELQALLRAIDTVKVQGNGIFIQQMERKADSVVLRVQSEEHIAVDKAKIYAEVEKQKQVELLAIRQEYEQKLHLKDSELNHAQERRQDLEKQNDLLATFVKSAIEKPISIGKINMSEDHSHSVQIGNVTSGNIAVGDHIQQSIRLEQLADSEVKNLLQQLGVLIDNAPLKKTDRHALETQINQLITLATQPVPVKIEIGKTVGILKDLSSIFKDLPAIGVQYGTLLAELAHLFI